MMELDRIGAFRCFQGTFNFSTDLSGPSDYIVIPPDAWQISVQLQMLSTAAATIEATVSTYTEIEAGTAVWKAWDNGIVPAGGISQDSTKGPIGAVRVNVTTPAPGDNAVVSIRTQGEQY